MTHDQLVRRFPGRGSSTPRSSRASATSSWSRARSSTASSTACTARRTSARRSTSPSTAATCRATTSAASTGGSTRGPIGTTSRSTRPTRTRTSPCCSTSRSRWGSAARGITKLDYGRMLAGVPDLSGPPAARPRRPGRLRRRHRRARAAVGQAHGRGAARARSAEAGQARARCAAPLHKMAEHFGRRGMLVLISDFYEEPDAVLEAVGAAAVPRQRHDRVPRARSGGARLHVRRCRRRSRTSRAASRFRSCPTRSPSSTARWSRRTSTR